MSRQLLSDNFETTYQIKTKGITIGVLKWELYIKNNEYTTSLNLNSEGPLSSLYVFQGKYAAIGKIKDGFYFSTKYNQFWKTKKKKRLLK